ncbi:MAG: acrB [Myxococcaceae bacterium]|nr:acrB [Myxococcaceae bacterium]
MQKLAEVCIRRPVFAAMLVLALVVVGAASYFRLGVDRFPAVDLPVISVRTVLPGASPEDVEAQLSDEIEAAVNTVEGISELRSVSSNGISTVFVTFNLERDINVAADDVRARVQGVLAKLPLGVEAPIVSKIDNDSSPVLTLALSADRSIRELTELAEHVVKVQLERASGVGEVTTVGGQERAIQVSLYADKLRAFGIPITAVRDAIAQQNANLPGGNVTTREHEQSLRTMGRFEDPKQFEQLVVATVNGTPIRLGELGVSEDGSYEQRSLARLNGLPTVVVEVRRQSGANTVATIDAVKTSLSQIEGQLPKDIRLELVRDQSRYIHAALSEINLHLILGSVLASLVVLAFMGSLRSTLIAAVAIPASVVSTFGMMWLLDFTLNGVTMLALVLMVGIVIDDAIVVLENIYRFVEEKRMDAFEAARAATAEIGLAVLATTLSLVVIFLPVSFMSSISGRFLYQFGITAAVAILVSLFVSFTLTPMMSARLLRRSELPHESGSRRGLYARIDRLYERSLRWALGQRALVAGVAALVMLSAVPLYRLVKLEWVPSDVDEAEFELNVTAPQTASIGAMDQVMRTVDRELRATRGVRTALVWAGGGFMNAVNTGGAFVRLAPHAERTFSLTRLWRETLRGRPLQAFEGNYSQREVMLAVRKKLSRHKDLRIGVRNASGFNLGSSNWDIDFSICGPELSQLAKYAEELRLRAEQIPGVVDGDTTLKLDKPEQRVRIDRERAADLSVRAEDIARTLRIGVGGDEEVSTFRDARTNQNYDVQLRLVEADRDGVAAISQLYVPRTAGSAAAGAHAAQGASERSALVRLDSLVQIESTLAPSRVDRVYRQRFAALRAGVAPGYGLADRLDAVKSAAADMHLPAAYTTRIMGRGRELERTFREFGWAFALSIVFMYMILASQFESLVHPLTILLSLPLSLPFALFSLWATDNTLNLYSALGMLVLFGVVKKNSILQVDHMNKLLAAGGGRNEAIIRANRDRLRPILMTTLALVLGMLPLWVGTGPGAEERRAVAVVVIGGQTLSLLLTLIVTPVAYSLFAELGLRRVRNDVEAGAISA